MKGIAAKAWAGPLGVGLLAAVVPLLGGCAPTQAQRQLDRALSDYFVGDFPSAVQHLKPLALKTDENFVLNNVRLGSAALNDYNLDEAEAAFLRAYEVMNSVGVNDGGRSLGAVLVDEKIKVWKGEPFERAMANFYLGLIYYMRQDYGNARGAFENALFKLRDYGEAKGKNDQYQEAESNFGLATLMLAKSYQRLGRGDLAEQNFKRAVELRGYLGPVADPRRNESSNLLLVVDFGRGPQKVTNFDGAIVGLGPKPQEAGPIPQPMVRVDGETVDLQGAGRPPVDLLALAQDRRWQSIDTIRTVKSAVGTGLLAAGLYEGIGRRHSNPEASLALLAAGAFLKATSQADVRQWEMLPRTVFILPLTVPPGKHDVTVEFVQIPGLRQTWRGLVVPDRGEATYYFHMQRYNSGPFTWPPPALAQTNPS